MTANNLKAAKHSDAVSLRQWQLRLTFGCWRGAAILPPTFFEKLEPRDAALRHLDADRAGTGSDLGCLEGAGMADRVDRVDRLELFCGAALSDASGADNQRFAAVEHVCGDADSVPGHGPDRLG